MSKNIVGKIRKTLLKKFMPIALYAALISSCSAEKMIKIISTDMSNKTDLSAMILKDDKGVELDGNSKLVEDKTITILIVRNTNKNTKNKARVVIENYDSLPHHLPTGYSRRVVCPTSRNLRELESNPDLATTYVLLTPPGYYTLTVSNPGENYDKNFYEFNITESGYIYLGTIEISDSKNNELRVNFTSSVNSFMKQVYIGKLRLSTISINERVPPARIETCLESTL